MRSNLMSLNKSVHVTEHQVKTVCTIKYGKCKSIALFSNIYEILYFPRKVIAIVYFFRKS